MTEQIENQKELYDKGLEDSRWKRLRLQILDREQHRCRFCDSQSELQVHHRHYHRSKSTGEWNKPWEYHPFFLITKSSTADSLFDKMLYAEEKMGERRLESLMTQRDEILRQDGLLGPRAERIRHLTSMQGNIRKIG